MRKFVVFTETDRTISVNQIIADDLWTVEITKCLTLCVCRIQAQIRLSILSMPIKYRPSNIFFHDE